jgi:DNA-binding FadR family transcriptional regulator
LRFRGLLSEALKRLAAENLVRSRRGPTGGNFVKKPSLPEMQALLSNSMMLMISGDFSHNHIIETRLEQGLCCRLAAFPRRPVSSSRRYGLLRLVLSSPFRRLGQRRRILVLRV